MRARLLQQIGIAAPFLFLSIAAAVTVPNCSCMAAPVQKTLKNVTTGQTPDLGEGPFAIVYAHQPNRAFVPFSSKLVVLDTSTFVPTLLHEFIFPLSTLLGARGELAGLTLTEDGRYILITTSTNKVLVANAAEVVAGQPLSLGYLNGTPAAGGGSIEVVADRRYAFVANERGSAQTSQRGTVEVYKLGHPTMNGSLSGTPVGYIPLGIAVVGLGFDKDRDVLYATSEIGMDSPGQCVIRGQAGEEQTGEGTLSLLDVRKLEHNASDALISSVAAGCNVNRVTLSPDGRTAWLSARESNHIVVFDTAKLRFDPTHALVASVQVGTSPIGATFVRQGTRIVTADSNRFLLPNATTGISVVDVEAALRGEKSVLGRIPTGIFPRDIALSPDGNTALVVLFGSGAIQAIDVRTLP